MLHSRRQSWNRTRSEHAPLAKPSQPQLLRKERGLSLSLPSSPIIAEQERRHSIGSLPMSALELSTKGVKFSNKVRIILIPSKDELDKHELYWDAVDMATFKEDAEIDVFLFAVANSMSMSQAIKKLYQQSPEELYDELFSSTNESRASE